MRDLARIERILGKLRERWLASPDLRLGQLVVVLARAADPFYFEDDALEAALDAGLSDDAAMEARRLSPAWEAEVERRVKAYEAGEAELTPWPVARAALRERIRKRLEDEARMQIIDDKGDTITLACTCGATFTADVYGENVTAISMCLIPTCPSCGAQSMAHATDARWRRER
jgi:hypothetical protein